MRSSVSTGSRSDATFRRNTLDSFSKQSKTQPSVFVRVEITVGGENARCLLRPHRGHATAFGARSVRSGATTRVDGNRIDTFVPLMASDAMVTFPP